MKSNQLPPKLVEKMYSEISGISLLYVQQSMDFTCPSMKDDDYYQQAKRCIQIAVDYSNEQVVFAVAELSQDITVLKHQRDELLELLKESRIEITKLKDHYHDIGHGVKHLNKIEQFFKKLNYE